MSPGALAMLAIQLAFSAPGAMELTPLQCRPGPRDESGTLLFCILGTPGARRGVLPAVLRESPDGARVEVWRDRDRGFQPWRIEVTELDGAPEPEIAVGTFKRTRFDPTPGRRLFIYGWDGTALYPRWLGSRLARPLLDFRFTRPGPAGVATLVALERGPAGRLVRTYRWNGFGFTSLEIRADEARGAGASALRAAFERD